MNIVADKALTQLRSLARLYHVQNAYYGLYNGRTIATAEALTQALQGLGAPLDSLSDVPEALRLRRREVWQAMADPVVVAWEGQTLTLLLRLTDPLSSHINAQMTFEDGTSRTWRIGLDALAALRTRELDRERYVEYQYVHMDALPLGYHHLRLTSGRQEQEVLVISAPKLAYTGASVDKRSWGVFLPLYSLVSDASWGGSTYSDLERLLAWAGEHGARAVGTLPLLPTFLDDPFNPSPYSPASRLLWSEFYVDLRRAPDLAACSEAQALLSDRESIQELSTLREEPLVDYRRIMAMKRRVLEPLAEAFYAKSGERSQEFLEFTRTRPAVEAYGEFRAVMERQQQPWQQWPQRLQAGAITPRDYDGRVKRYYVYAQWLAHRQMTALSAMAQECGASLYLDMPLGVLDDGFDVWRQQDAFARTISCGAPPDALFIKGQKWGFPPPHPETIRWQGYRYFIESVRHHMRHAGFVRLDHVMGLHRLFWVPVEMEATQGVYVRYHAEEFYAILCLESHRHQTVIIGEDLGTVPGYVRREMARHNFHGMYVAQFEVNPARPDVLGTPSRRALACLNTHDMHPFASFLQSMDIEDKLALGLVDEATSQREARERREQLYALAAFLERKGWLQHGAHTDEDILDACLFALSESPAHMLLVNLEDLWLETLPQNTPGITAERPNWRRKAKYSFDEFSKLPQVLAILERVDQLRNRGERA